MSITAAHAVEYVTLTKNTKTKALTATDLVEVVGTSMNNNGFAFNLDMTFADGAVVPLVLRGKEGGLAFDDMKGNSFTGLTSITLQAGNNDVVAVTLKITPAEEIGAAAPGTVLVVPDTATGNYSVVVEESDDLVNWQNFATQVITAGSSSKFYRTRIIQTVSP